MLGGVDLLVAAKILAIVLQCVLIPGAIWAWKVWGGKVQDEKLKSFIDMLVRAAEEQKIAGTLTSDKQEWVWTQIEAKYPKLAANRQVVQVLIDAAVQAAGIGASAKTEEQKK